MESSKEPKWDNTEKANPPLSSKDLDEHQIFLLSRDTAEKVRRFENFSAREAREIKAAKKDVAPPKEIFLVHGHDHAALGEVERFVRTETDIAPIILSEQTNDGKTLIEKFEHYSTNAAYAIIIMTPDDVGRALREPEGSEAPRARENVIFEMGYFYGRLGRRNVSVLSFGTKLPGDINGLVYISKDNWKYELAKELASAGFKI